MINHSAREDSKLTDRCHLIHALRIMSCIFHMTVHPPRLFSGRFGQPLQLAMHFLRPRHASFSQPPSTK